MKTKEEINELSDKVLKYAHVFMEQHENKLDKEEALMFENIMNIFKLNELSEDEKKLFTIYYMIKCESFEEKESECPTLKSKTVKVKCDTCSKEECKKRLEDYQEGLFKLLNTKRVKITKI